MSRRNLLLAFGVGAAILGLAIAFMPGLDVLSLPETGPLTLAVAAILIGAARTWTWIRSDTHEVVPRLREGGTKHTVPGEDFDRDLAGIPTLGGAAGDQRSLHLREDLRELAIDVLTEYQGYSKAEAERRLDDGSWTDDRYAAEFFASLDGTGSSFRESVTGTVLSSEGPFRRRAKAAAAAIYAATGGSD